MNLRKFEQNNSKAKLQLLGRALGSITFHNGNKLALIYVRHKDFVECKASFDDTLGMVDYALNCYLIDIAIAIIEQYPNEFYISLRSKKSNVGNVAKNFGGGGHANVSAFQYKGNIEDILENLILTCKDTSITNPKEHSY